VGGYLCGCCSGATSAFARMCLPQLGMKCNCASLAHLCNPEWQPVLCAAHTRFPPQFGFAHKLSMQRDESQESTAGALYSQQPAPLVGDETPLALGQVGAFEGPGSELGIRRAAAGKQGFLPLGQWCGAFKVYLLLPCRLCDGKWVPVCWLAGNELNLPLKTATCLLLQCLCQHLLLLTSA
jgi:hypothetical protein